MKFYELVYGEAADVAAHLHTTDSPLTVSELMACLTNALNRIAALEKEQAITRASIAAVSHSAQHAGNVASCLANGSKPD